MNCPVCKNEMVEKDFGGVMVDVCENGCKGIWFDWLELEKLDETGEGLGAALEEALSCQRQRDDNRGTINCPKCHKPMVAHLYKSAKDVTVDECYICGGFFLDSGELKVLREHFLSEDQRDVFVSKIMNAEPEFQKAESDLQKQKLRTAAIRKMFGFLILSKYFPREKSS